MTGAASLLVLALTTACTAEFVRVPQTVGPSPAVASPTAGRLIVATEDISGSDADVPAYVPYEVLDSTGRLVEKVENASGEDVVQLEPGRYSVQVETMRRKVLAIPVEIVAGRTTEVHVDGKWTPDPSSTPASLVIGPEGSPIGYQSTTTTAAPARYAGKQ